MSKKKKKGNSKKKLTQQLTKQLKKVIKVHGPELALGFVTGLVTKLIAGKLKTGKKGKKQNEDASQEQPTLATAVEETTKAVVAKVKAAVTPKTPVSKKKPVKSVTAKAGTMTEPVLKSTV